LPEIAIAVVVVRYYEGLGVFPVRVANSQLLEGDRVVATSVPNSHALELDAALRAFPTPPLQSNVTGAACA
jgi:hypothetical protein